MNKDELIEKVKQLTDLTNDEKAELIAGLRKKKYGLVWENHVEDVEEHLREYLPVLKEDTTKALTEGGEDAPNHILIEGDNLEALTALTYTHEGKVDVIYIDPPYNTGNKDFVYNDSYVDSEDGYRHSKWLSFMEKRLRIAKKLLSDRGVIFISIDDNEQANLKLLCDEVFGGRNYIGQLIIKTATDNNATQINTEHEYIQCYAKYKEFQPHWVRTSSAAKLIYEKYIELKEQFSNVNDIQKELRIWIKNNKSTLPQVAHYNNVDDRGVYSTSSNSSNPHPGGYDYDIIHPVTKLPVPKPANGWRWPFRTFQEYDGKGEIEWGKDNTTQPHVKKRIETSKEYLRSMIYEDNRGTTMALADMFEGRKVFDNPKSSKIIATILDFTSSKNSIILDFFAGSGTTLHATMQLNKEDGGRRQCILVTNNENGICENVTYERNKRVINGYTTPKGEKVEGLHDNNLRYYKVDFVERDNSLEGMRKLMETSTDLLCIKHDIYNEEHAFGNLKLRPHIARYFADETGQKMLIIYKVDAIEYFVKEIAKMPEETQVMVYVFSTNNYAMDADFEEVADKVTLCALPAAIYNAYLKVLPKKKMAGDKEQEEPTLFNGEEDEQ